MTDTGATPTDLTALVLQLDELEGQLKQLNERKKELREQLKGALQRAGLREHATPMGDHTIRLKLRQTVKVRYDEEVLKQRLGERYSLLLEPDARRMRKHMDVVAPLLDPVLDLVGTPSRDLVAQLVKEGTFSVEDFAGAFEKEKKATLYVQRVKPRATGPTEDERKPY